MAPLAPQKQQRDRCSRLVVGEVFCWTSPLTAVCGHATRGQFPFVNCRRGCLLLLLCACALLAMAFQIDAVCFYLSGQTLRANVIVTNSSWTPADYRMLTRTADIAPATDSNCMLQRVMPSNLSLFAPIQWDYPPPMTFNSSLVSGLLTISCPTTATYTTDMQHDGIGEEREWITYDEPVTLPEEEVIIVRCEGHGDNVHTQSVPNKAALNRARSARAKLILGAPPLNIIMLGIDSLSRAHFFRTFNRTATLLDELEDAGNHSVYTFNRLNVVGEHTPQNVRPMYSGRRYKHWDPLHPDSFIWHELRQLDYVTMFAENFCTSGFKKVAIGDNKRQGVAGSGFDHTFWDVFCKVRDQPWTYHYFGYNFAQTGIGFYQGDRKWSEIVLDYVSQYLENPAYDEVGRFVVTDFAEGHVTEIMHVKELDVPLERFLRNTIQRLPNSLIVLNSDHGSRYPPYAPTVEGAAEHRLPLLSMIFPKDWLAAFPGAAATLTANQLRLVSAFDIHRTILDIITADLIRRAAPSELHPLPLIAAPARVPRTSVFQFTAAKGELSTALSLFNHNISTHRTCSEAGIPSEWCSCSEWTRMSLWRNAKLNRLVEKSIAWINEQNPHHSGSQCQKVALARVYRFQSTSNKVVMRTTKDQQNVQKAIENEGRGCGSLFDCREAEERVYHIVFSVQYGATFQAYLREFDDQTAQVLEIKQSTIWSTYKACAPDAKALEYCLCKLPAEE